MLTLVATCIGNPAHSCTALCADGWLQYLTPLQIDQLNTASEMRQEQVAILPGGKLSFELAPYATVNIRFGI